MQEERQDKTRQECKEKREDETQDKRREKREERREDKIERREERRQEERRSMSAKLHTVQSMMTLVFMNQTAMDDPNVIVLMNVSGNTTSNRDRVTPQKLDNF